MLCLWSTKKAAYFQNCPAKSTLLTNIPAATAILYVMYINGKHPSLKCPVYCSYIQTSGLIHIFPFLSFGAQGYSLDRCTPVLCY